MEILSTQVRSISEILETISSRRSKASDVVDTVRPIVEEVKNRGDAALKEMTQKFEGWDPESLQVSAEEIREAYAELERTDAALIPALKAALKNIRTFHQSMLTRGPVVETVPGVKVWRRFAPIEKIGLYVPGGIAAYPSTVLMLAGPAQVAKVPGVVMCTPAKGGKCSSAVLVAADLCGLKPEQIYKVGGSQAIAAMAYGTESIPKVYKIFGPGNAYVAAAKELRPNGVDIDMPAGPSEVAVIANEKANPEWVAADLLSQLEHGGDSQALLITFSEDFAARVKAFMEAQTELLSRKAIIQESFGRSFAVVVKSVEEAVSLANDYASEHLEIILGDEAAENALAEQVVNAGSIFLGQYSSEPLGDYATGSNHTLPTSGYARNYNPLSIDSFGKWLQIQRLSEEGLRTLAPIVATLSAAEGLDAHGAAVSIRLKS